MATYSLTVLDSKSTRQKSNGLEVRRGGNLLIENWILLW